MLIAFRFNKGDTFLYIIFASDDGFKSERISYTSKTEINRRRTDRLLEGLRLGSTY
jgi:hypothetical protein